MLGKVSDEGAGGRECALEHGVAIVFTEPPQIQFEPPCSPRQKKKASRKVSLETCGAEGDKLLRQSMTAIR